MTADTLSNIYHNPNRAYSLGGVKRLFKRARQLHVQGITRQTN